MVIMDETQPAKYRILSDSFRGLTDRLPSFRTVGKTRCEDKTKLIMNDVVALNDLYEFHRNQEQQLPPGNKLEAHIHQPHCPRHQLPQTEDAHAFRYIQQNLDNQCRDLNYGGVNGGGPTNAAACYYNPMTSAVSIRYEPPPTGNFGSVKERIIAKKKARRVACCCRFFVISVVILALATMATGAYLYVWQPKVFGAVEAQHQRTWNALITWFEENNLNFMNTGSSRLDQIDVNAEPKILEDKSLLLPGTNSVSLGHCVINCTTLPPRHLLEHYYQSGCRPQSRRGCLHCPDYFQCPAFGAANSNFKKNVASECRFHERSYSPGEVFFNRAEKSCQFCGCRNISESGSTGRSSTFPWNRMGSAGVGVVGQTIHREALNSSLEVVCVNLLCPYIRPNRTDCHLVETGNECCPRRQVCPEQFDEDDPKRKLRCHWKGLEYRYDELIRPALEEDPCLQCRCNEEWDDRNPAASSASCSLQKCADYDNQKYHLCTPIYANATCCPVDFICSDPSTNLAETSKTAQAGDRNATCRLGDLHREVAAPGTAQIRVAKLFKGRRTLCSRCECRVPPMFTCMLERLNNCDKVEGSGNSATGLTRQLGKPTPAPAAVLTVSTLAPFNNATGELDEVIFLNRRRRH